MREVTAVAIVSVMLGLGVAHAQDIAGLEDCTKTSGLDKRTGCFQSNIDYLSRLIAKNASEAQQRLNAAKVEIIALQRVVAELQTRVEQMQNAAKKPDAK